MLTGCVTSAPPPQIIRPELPAAPETFGAPIPLPVPRKGDNPKLFAFKALAAAREANLRLEHDRDFYVSVLQRYSGSTP